MQMARLLAMRSLALLLLVVAACTATDDIPQPDAALELDDATPDALDACAALQASLTPRPDLGTCAIAWEPALPSSCTPDATGATATCSMLYADAGGAIGVYVPAGLKPCRFIACAT